jgi:hypothetical protein
MRPHLLLQAAPAPTGTSQGADDRAQAFRPVQGGQELQSGERLLVIAYMAFWFCAIVLVVVSFQKQSRLNQRIAALESALSRSRGAKGDAPPEKGGD